VRLGVGRGIYLRDDDRRIGGTDPGDTTNREDPDPEHH